MSDRTRCSRASRSTTATSHPAEVAARLRGFIVQHDRTRRLRQELIQALDAYSYRLKLENLVTDGVIGRLRKKVAEYDHDAECIRRQRRRTFAKPQFLRAAA